MSNRTKTQEQITAIQEVQQATEAAMAAVIIYLQTTNNPTAEEAHAVVDEVLETYNCESPEGHIVAGGIQSIEPHEKGSGSLKRGEPIVIDIFPRSKITGYFADMSRTVCLGQPSVELPQMYDAVLRAQELAISMTGPGVKGIDIQSAVEEYFTQAGYKTSGQGTEFPYAEGFVHGVGHGVGLSVHEAPRIGRNSTDVLEEGDVITIEPGLYYPHLGGIRLEDMLWVTKDGAKNLTQFPKQFII